jgi:hypothetical protein
MTQVLPDGKTIEHDTVQCCHCGGHFLVMTDDDPQGQSLLDVHRCFKCDAETCGQPACVANCTPTEKALEQMEKNILIF